ncbi:hypothetical protein RND71_023478 [Anisodus tanguticus]|uniref:Uncharacterized protein n=1 Tax=Anisodus tanguticus TaxID=243964 RepID=A0AAE1RU00_9SOLA|nr:hypothetical protein RND71_023478 [Anisodus tanguticus]
MAAQTTLSFLKTQSFSNIPNPSKPSPMSVSPKSTKTKDYSPMSTSPANNKVYKHYTSINDLRPVEEDCTQVMILLGSDKPLQVSYPGDNENPIDVDTTSDFSNLASKSTFPTRKSKRVFKNQFGEYQSGKRSRKESTFPVDTTTSSSTNTNFSVHNKQGELLMLLLEADRQRKGAGNSTGGEELRWLLTTSDAEDEDAEDEDVAAQCCDRVIDHRKWLKATVIIMLMDVRIANELGRGSSKAAKFSIMTIPIDKFLHYKLITMCRFATATAIGGVMREQKLIFGAISWGMCCGERSNINFKTCLALVPDHRHGNDGLDIHLASLVFLIIYVWLGRSKHVQYLI